MKFDKEDKKEKKMKKASANWSIQCNVSCPHCEEYIDLREDMDDFFEALPAPGIPDDSFNEKFECPVCNKEFIIEAIYY